MGFQEDRLGNFYPVAPAAPGGDRLTHQQAVRLGLCPKCRRLARGGECKTCDNRALFDPVAMAGAAG